MIKLIATDMDGTFLDEHGGFDHDRFKVILKRCHQKGITFTAASGRSLLTLKNLFRSFEGNMAFIAENGCIVEDKGAIIFESYMPKTAWSKLVEYLEADENCLGYLLSGEKGAYVPLSTSKAYMEQAKQFYSNVTLVNLDAIDDVVIKLSAQFSDGKANKSAEKITQQMENYQAVVTGFDHIDIIPQDIHKAVGLRALCDNMGISTSEVIAFGDNYNDIELLEEAGTAVVPQNAVQELKNTADLVIGDHSEASVMTYIESLVAK